MRIRTVIVDALLRTPLCPLWILGMSHQMLRKTKKFDTEYQLGPRSTGCSGCYKGRVELGFRTVAVYIGLCTAVGCRCTWVVAVEAVDATVAIVVVAGRLAVVLDHFGTFS